jgi:hypothetical protein
VALIQGCCAETAMGKTFRRRRACSAFPSPRRRGVRTFPAFLLRSLMQTRNEQNEQDVSRHSHAWAA